MTDTLAYHRSRPFLRNLDLSQVPVGAVSTQWGPVQEFLKEKDGSVCKAPEEDALWFYMSYHAMFDIQQNVHEYEPLGGFMEYVERYHEMMQVKSLRMFYYLLMITTRESRHAHPGNVLTSIWKEYPDSIKQFHQSILNNNEMVAVDMLAGDPPDVPLGIYTKFLTDQFNTAKYSGGFGGEEWGKTASCLNEFVWGHMTAEMMMDTAFTLCHNNGPIFDKGMVFSSYDAGEIRKILDVQRSGQIPQLVVDHKLQSITTPHVTAEMIAYQSEFEKLVPSFGGYVDWHEVEKLGALGSYSYHKNAQYEKYGKPSNLAHADKMAAMKAKVAAKKKAQDNKIYMENHIEIFPGQFVETVKRKAA